MPSLYENLLEPEAPEATISAAPVKYEFKQAPVEEEKKPDASLRFQPVKRPTAAQKPKARPSAASIPIPADAKGPAAASNIEKWTATEEDLEFAAQAQQNRRPRGGKRKKKNQKKLKFGDFYDDDDENEDIDFDAIYDPAIHTNLKAYQHSDEFYRAIRDWKDRLHAHEKAPPGRKRTPDHDVARGPKQAFAPPSSYLADTSTTVHSEAEIAHPPAQHSIPPPPPAESGATLSAPPVRYSPAEPSDSATISAAPVRYNNPDPSPNLTEPDTSRSNRPAQKGFGQRLLEKYGWQAGHGLGASGDGITTILQHQPQKRKKRPDAEGGGWAGPSVGRIVGGKKRRLSNPEEEKWTTVVRFTGMLAGADAPRLIAEGSLMQELGEAMEAFGKVETLRFDHAAGEGGSSVFVKFTSPLSAYNAIKAAEDGKDFLRNGNAASAVYFDEERFEANDLRVEVVDGEEV